MKFKERFFLVLLLILISLILVYQFSFYLPSQKIKHSIHGYINHRAEKAGLSIGVYIKTLRRSFIEDIISSRFYFAINKDEVFPAASLMKIPLMVCAFLAEREGIIDLETIYVLKEKDKTPGSGILKSIQSGESFKLIELVEMMICESDNTASNILIDVLGFEYLNQCFKKLGLTQTVLDRKILDNKKRKKGIENFTTSSDMAYLLAKIYKNDLLDKATCEVMLDYLSRQKVKDRIPRYLPKNLTIAHKTGTLQGVIHDVGIVFTDKQDYIICVLTKGAKTYQAAKLCIASISEFVYYTLVYGN